MNITNTGLSKNTLETIVTAIGQFPAVEKAVIFGSRANNTYKNYSDIDIAIYAPKMLAEFSKLWNKLDDLSLIYKLDIIHYDALTNEDLKQKIDKEGVVIFKK